MLTIMTPCVRNDELKNGLSMDRLSCHRFAANFRRLLLHVAAYNLLNAVCDADEILETLRHAQPQTWHVRLIKVAVSDVQSTRRALIEVSSSWPHWSIDARAVERAQAFPLSGQT